MGISGLLLILIGQLLAGGAVGLKVYKDSSIVIYSNEDLIGPTYAFRCGYVLTLIGAVFLMVDIYLL